MSFKAEIFNASGVVALTLHNRDAMFRIQLLLRETCHDTDVREFMPRLNSTALPFEFRKMVADTCQANGNGKLPMIKMVRMMTGAGLKESKDFVDACQNEFFKG